MAETVQLLIAFGADVNAVGGIGHVTPLMLAVSPDELELFLDRLAFRGSSAKRGEQPNQHRVLRELAQAGADLQARNRGGLTVTNLATKTLDTNLMIAVHELRSVAPVGRQALPPAPPPSGNVQTGGQIQQPAAQLRFGAAPGARLNCCLLVSTCCHAMAALLLSIICRAEISLHAL